MAYGERQSLDLASIFMIVVIVTMVLGMLGCVGYALGTTVFEDYARTKCSQKHEVLANAFLLTGEYSCRTKEQQENFERNNVNY